MPLAFAASSSTAVAVSPRSRRQLQRPGGAALLLQRPTAVAAARPRRPSRTAAAVKPLSAAQKKVFTSFTDMVQQSTEPVLVEFYATWWVTQRRCCLTAGTVQLQVPCRPPC